MIKKSLFYLILPVLFSMACNALNRLFNLEPFQTTQPASLQTPRVIFNPPTQVSCSLHVSPDGDDTNPGTEVAPWRTLGHAADTAQTGDTVCLHAGTYVEAETVSFTRSGDADVPITFASAPGELATIEGSLYVTDGVSYLNFIGLVVGGFRIWGVSLQGNNHHILFSNLEVIGGEAGFHFTEGESGQAPSNGPVSDVILQDSLVHDAAYTAVDCTPGPCDRITFRRLEIYGSGIEAGFGGDGLGLERGQDVVVEDCYIHDNGGDGIDLNSRDFDGNVSGILVRRNRVARNHLQGIKLWAGGRMENNFIWGQGINPVMVGKYASTLEVINNTIAYNMYDPSFSDRDYSFIAAYPEEGRIPAVTLTLVNNIFAFNTGPDFEGPTGIYLGPGVALTENHNLFWSREDGEIQAEFVQGHDSWFTRAEIATGVWSQFSEQGQNDLVLDPLFLAAWPEVDAHLAPGSPAINAGSSNEGIEADLDQHQRDGQPDIGAYEY